MVRLGSLEEARFVSRFDPFGGNREDEARDGRFWVEVADDGVVRGYASLSHCPFHGNPYLAFLFVRMDYRRLGVASRLVAAIEAVVKGRRLFMSTEQPNQAMLELLAGRRYIEAGALSGLNDDHGGAPEVFFYRDV